jgi:(p)ppGpp synthase/HD superfamily hydrolase
MMMSEIEQEAFIFAVAAHEAVGQRRKYTNEPYLTHPFDVRRIMFRGAKMAPTTFMGAAALLHDVVEDTKVSIAVIHNYFGEEVSALVGWLTDVSKPEDGNRAKRKQIDLLHTASAPSEAKTIKLADLISNTKSIVEHDKDFAGVYLREKAAILEVCGDADPGLLEIAHKSLEEAKSLISFKNKNSSF